ncbi:glutaredoxin family protein [Halalkalibacter wakoensis JCM 9140]|uniref:Glutaredoxin family protein n=1 Tax=Halalkalibacter wakoensis JCM 9140 TaxID=1236970 RepID=W4Q7A2_9BACI|nr:glutaredoxin family protein [Halalkalibacter wakoensis]GAE27877.1 glutaredoxin family protein [Halalkalibacter wakoensis JCM 9140]
MLEVKMISKLDCPLCDKALAKIQPLAEEFNFEINVIDIYQDDELLEKYQIMIPVILINNEEVDFGQISKEKVRKRLLEING